MNYLLVWISVVFGAVGQILFKKGMSVIGGFELRNILSILFQPHIFLGFVFYGTSSILWLSVLSKHQLSTVYPFLAMGYVLTTLAGVYLFGETVKLQNLVGIGMIICGIILVTRR